eukprot:711705-Prorocentrum_minimum.AAC.5
MERTMHTTSKPRNKTHIIRGRHLVRFCRFFVSALAALSPIRAKVSGARRVGRRGGRQSRRRRSLSPWGRGGEGRVGRRPRR